MKLRFYELAVYCEPRMKLESRRHAEILAFLACVPVTIMRTFTKVKPPIPKTEDFDPFSQKTRRTDRKKVQTREDLYQIGITFSRK